MLVKIATFFVIADLYGRKWANASMQVFSTMRIEGLTPATTCLTST